MYTLLISVTMVSLLLAAAMAIVVMRVFRDERRRSAARAALLAELSAEPVPPARAVVAVPRGGPARPVSADDIEIRRPTPGLGEPASVHDLFSQPERTSPWSGRLAVIGALVAVLAIAGTLAAARSHGRQAPATAATASTASAPLELLSLRYEQEPNRMTITGLVQNPRGGTQFSHVTATAFLFGSDGAFLASGRAPLDYTTLSPGDESPFVISVPVTSPVARYRVGFRGGDGRVIAHVDRRAAGTLAERD